MRKIFIVFLIFVSILTLNLSPVLAQDEFSSPSASVDTTKPLDVFKLFWPVTAGKTIDESLYFLKSLKENLRGALIFGAAQKADYMLLLATKRVLEADKLLTKNKKDLSDQTINLAKEKLDNAKTIIYENQNLGGTSVEIGNKLNNLDKYLNYQIATRNYKPFQEVLDQVKQIKQLLNI